MGWWEVVRPSGKVDVINRLAEIRQDSVVLHRGFVEDKLPPAYKFLQGAGARWACYWFEELPSRPSNKSLYATAEAAQLSQD